MECAVLLVKTADERRKSGMSPKNKSVRQLFSFPGYIYITSDCGAVAFNKGVFCSGKGIIVSYAERPGDWSGIYGFCEGNIS